MNSKSILAPTLALCFAIPALAQVAGSEFYGTVTDPTGAIVPAAHVRLVSEARGFTQEIDTNSEGYYLFPNLLPGYYRIEVTKAGLAPYTRASLQAVSARRIRVDVSLSVAGATEQVTVTAGTEQLETASQALGQTIDNQRVLQLPLNGRSYLELATLAPNTVPAATGSRQGTGFVLGGSRFNSNNLMVDGVDNNTVFFNRDVVRPSLDSIEEFRIISNAPSAEYGRNMGGVVTVITKSGSNDFRGTAFWFNRNNHLNARNAFSSMDSPFFLRNQFGASLGGPVVRDRVFFFGNFEKLRQRESGVSNLNVPPPDFRQGVFPSNRPIFDPRTTRRDPMDPSRFIRDPFPGNRISEYAMDTVGRRIVQEAWPAGNIAPTQYRTQVPRGYDEDQWNVRGDWRANNRNQISARYSTYSNFANAENGFPLAYSGAANPINIGHSAMLSDTHTFGPAIVNELRLGFNRFTVDQKPLNFGTDPAGAIGLRGTNPSPEFSSFPSIQTGYAEFGSGSNFVISAEDTFHIADNLSWYRKKHTMKAGIDIRYTRANVFGSFVPFGQIRFGSIFSSNPSQASTGDVIADMLLGYPQSIQLNVQFSPLYNRQTIYGAFFQDDWRVGRRLTLNLGLRYELFEPVVDKYDRQSNPNMGNPLGEFHVATRDNKPPEWVQREIALLPIPTVEKQRLFTPGASRSLTRTNKMDFSPRFGFAYELAPTTIVRGGFGVFRSLTGGGTFVRLGFNPPNFIETFFIAPDAVTPIAKLQDGIPSFQQGSGRIDGLSPRHLFEHNRTQLTMQWNLNLQRQLARDLVLEAGYIGSRGRNLTIFLLENQIRNKADYGKGQAARPVPLFGNIWGWGSDGTSRYHAGYARLEKRWAAGLSLLASYTFSKSLDNAVGDFAVGAVGISVAPIDSYDLSREYGPSFFDTRHRLVVSSLYELPFGRGRRWMKSSGVLDWIVGGWQVAGMTTVQTGNPFDVKMQTTRTFSFNNQNRPNRIADGSLPRDQRTVDRWFDTSAFTTPADFQLGNSGRSPAYGPGLFNIDATLAKRFPVGEKRSLQFRWELFNLTNTVNFGMPVYFVGNPDFGKILSSRDARQMQLGLRLSF